MKHPWSIFILALFVLTSSCATFRCDRLPKQAIKPQQPNRAYLVTEQISYDEISSLQFENSPGGGGVASNLRLSIAAAGGACLSDEKIDGEIKLQTAIALARYKTLPDIEKIRVAYGGETYLEAMNMESYSVPLPAEGIIEARYKQQFRKMLYEKMRTDAGFRKQMSSPDAVWFDCKTSITQGNAGTWKLETLLCACSCLLIPVHHNKVLDVQVSVYENEKNYKHKYEDAWNAVCWLPLLPVGLVQGSNDKIVDSIKKNLAITVVNDFQKELGKNKQ